MMRTYVALAVACCVLVVCRATSKGHEQCHNARELMRTLKLGSEAAQLAFVGLDVDKADGKINLSDLKDLYWYGEVEFAREKFIRLVDKSQNGELEANEIQAFLSKPASILATIECSYFRSQSIKSLCYADQMLTYIALVLDDINVEDFYRAIELKTDHDEEIKINDIEKLRAYGLRDVNNFMEELGGNDDGVITPDEFHFYVTQESISDDFRTCRKSIGPNNIADYDEVCMIKELISYTEDDLTEMDIAWLFRLYDTDNDGDIDESDLVKIPGVHTDLAKKIVKLIDRSITKDCVITYGEFRTYMKSPTVQLQMERECIEKEDAQEKELLCINGLFIELARELHTPIWLLAYDLEQLFTFEAIDQSNDGKIGAIDVEGWTDGVGTMFVNEVNHDLNRYIDLEEFNEYVDLPHMVYGMGDCMLHKKCPSRISCYIEEIKEVVKNAMCDKEIISWFSLYNTDEDNLITAADTNEGKDIFGSQEGEDYFLTELGMGDKTISLFEFTWFVKQQELAKMYQGVPSRPRFYHEILKMYLNDHMTEYDTQETFGTLDTNKDHELDPKDIPGVAWPKVVEHIDQKGGNDKDNVVNFNEFWLWLHTTLGSTSVLDKLGEDCAKKHKKQADEISCYVNAITSGSLTPH